MCKFISPKQEKLQLIILHKIEDHFRELLAPNHCLITGERISGDKFLSQKAIDKFNLAPEPWELTASKVDKVKEFNIKQLFGLISASENSDTMDLIYKMKYEPYFKIGVELGEHLARKIKLEAEIQFDVIVPVPIHHAKHRERGYNQSDYIAVGIANKIGVTIDKTIVKRNFYTGTQTKLSAQNRQKNMKKAIIHRKTADPNKNYLICDDVYTTGATMNATAKALMNAGAENIYGASIIIA